MSATVDSLVHAMSIAASNVNMSSRLKSFCCVLMCLLPIVSGLVVPVLLRRRGIGTFPPVSCISS